MLFSTLLFFIFSSVLLVSALAAIGAKSTVHGVMFLILAFVNASGLFIMLGAEFLGLLLIVVYVGAIAVLFLFVVMMLNLDEVKNRIKKVPFPFITIIAVIMAIELCVIAVITDIANGSLRKFASLPINQKQPNIEAIGNVLYTQYFYPFQLAGVVLFVAMIGAIVLTISENRKFVRKQSISKQVSRKREDAVEVVKVDFGKGLDI